MSGALSLGVIGGADGLTAVFVTGSPAPLVIYLLAINVLAFAVYGWDKARSKVQGARRVPEKTLFLLAILGGSVGAILGMRVWHHKTRHWYFKYGLPAILLAQLALELVDPRLENAARTLGASEWKVFWQVSLPLAWRGIVAGGMLAFARGMGEFGATLMIAGNIPGKTQTLALAIYDAFQAGNDEQATVLVVLTSCLCLTILVLADRLFGGKAGGR